MNVIEAIKKKRAVRHFTEEKIPDDVVFVILDAGRRAQSSKNTQPWEFIAIQEKETLEALSHMGKYASHVKDAALAIALISEPGTDFDMGQAAAYMQLAAMEYGIGSCLVAIYEPEDAKKLLGVPDDRDFKIAIDFGYPAEQEKQPTTGKGRKVFDQVVHWEKW
jgi:nitroreductase